MEQNGINSLISRYIDSVQVLPLEMQSRITEYLQSDLQQRHLLTLAKRTVEDLKTAADDDAKKKHLRQLIYVLVAIQNICDRRISNLDELDEVVETHSLKLMNAKLKVDTTISSQLAASNTENTPESEVDISDQEASDHECNVNLIRRNSTQESSSDKCIVNSSSSNARCNDVNIRGKERFPLRAVSTNNRAASRRSLNKWVSGVHRFKSVTSIISTNIDNALKSHSDFNHRSTKRTSLDLKQHRVGVTYARYSRAQQQRFKSRVLSRPLHSNRTRAPQYLDYAMLRHGPRKRKTVVSKYAHPDSLRNRNETRLVGGVKRRHEHSHSSLYDNDDCFDSPVKPLSELTTEEDKMDERDAYTLLSLKSPRRLGERSSEWNNSYSENETSEDVDCSDNIGHNAYSVNCDQDCPRETQRSRTSTNQLSNVPNSDAGRHKLYRLRRAPNSSAHSNQPHRLNSVVTSVSPNIQLIVVLFQLKIIITATLGGGVEVVTSRAINQMLN
ncbi:unnamed protein product [Heterobilharzia americana]|nr:unnamed protein product [Heterobilharzia americana]